MATSATGFGPLAGLKSVLRYGVFGAGVYVGIQAWYQAYDDREEHHHHHLHKVEHKYEHKAHELQHQINALKAQNQALQDQLDPAAAEARKARLLEAQKPELTFEDALKNPQAAEDWVKSKFQ